MLSASLSEEEDAISFSLMEWFFVAFSLREWLFVGWLGGCMSIVFSSLHFGFKWLVAFG